MVPWTPDAAARAVIGALAPGGAPVAAVVHPDAIYAAASVVDLVDGVWHALPDRAHAVLRGRILTNRPASDLDRAVVQLCSRKLGADVPAGPGGIAAPVVWLAGAAAASRAHHTALAVEPAPAALTADWLRPTALDGPLRYRDRPVRAALVGPDGRVLLAARNTNGRHRLRHAEVNLLQAWGRPLPDGATVWVGLQCCRMCAAWLVAAAAGALTVRYVDAEPGRFGRDTALQHLGWERGPYASSLGAGVGQAEL